MTIRSFLAFELPGPIKSVLSDTLEGLKKSGLDVRWATVEKIHLTVVFLGDVPEEKLELIKESAAAVCVGYEPFTVALKGIGVFGPPRRPRVLWAGVSGETSRMGAFKNELVDALAPAGIKIDTRAFRPHLTLGRFRGGGPGNVFEHYDDIQSDECRLGELVLFKSDLTPGGAVYTILERMPLKDANGFGRDKDR